MSVPASLVDPIRTLLDDVVAEVRAAGVACTREPDELQPPAAIVAAPTILDGTLGGVISVEVPIYCVVADPGSAGLDAILEMVGLIRDRFGIVSAAPALWTSPLNPAGLPSYLIPLHTTTQIQMEG